MNAQKMTELLSRYVDDDVSEEERSAVEKKLAASDEGGAEWRRELAFVQSVPKSISRRRAISPGLWEGITDRIEREARDAAVVAGVWGQFEWAAKRLAPVFAAAAVILIALMGNSSTEATVATYEDFLLAQWDADDLKQVVLSDDELTADDVLYFSLKE